MPVFLADEQELDVDADDLIVLSERRAHGFIREHMATSV